MKKLLTILLVIVLGVFAASCSKGGETSNPAEDASDVELEIDKNATATISIGIPGGNSNEETMIQCLIDDFKTEYPNVSVKLKYISINSGTYGNNIQRMATAGTLPDIIWTNSPDIYEAYGYMQSLDAFIEKTDKAGLFGAEGFDGTFYTEYFDMGKVQGTRYVVPRSCDCVVTFYRKDMFEAAGVDMTKVVNGWTWDDLLDACAKLRVWLDNNGMQGVYCLDPNLTSWLSVCVPLLNSYGSEVITTDGRNVIDDAGTEKALALVRDMVEKRYIADSQVTVSQGFEQGASPMYFQSCSISSLQSKNVLKDKIDLVTFPLVGEEKEDGTTDYSNAKIGAGIAGYCITKTSQNKDISWAFLCHLLSKEGQQNMALNGLNLASIRKDLSDPAVANWGKGYENFNLEAYTWGSQYKTSPSFFEYAPIKAKTAIDKALTDLFVDGTNMKKTTQEAIASCKKAIDDAMAD
ncbi:MAG: extracellular solute-binding protein [Candidatus Borkfalkiaceae bacterium]|nr:extracellular solute-binding protein [Christensenellaceae bacterium]